MLRRCCCLLSSFGLVRQTTHSASGSLWGALNPTDVYRMYLKGSVKLLARALHTYARNNVQISICQEMFNLCCK
jgi:hypothetical protein